MPTRVGADRIEELDVIRGIALLGVAVVNATTIFRVSLFLYLDTFHTDRGAADHAVDWIVGLGIESRSFALFSLLFGIGLAIFHERTTARSAAAGRLLARRLLILLAVGLAHLLLLWNGDILTAFALCGLAVLPLIGRSPTLSLALCVAIGVLYCLPLHLPDPVPHAEAALRHGAAAARAYGSGSFASILAFRTDETLHLMLPLLLLTLPRIIALFLLGHWLWRRGVVHHPEQHLGLLRAGCALGLLVGGGASAYAALVVTAGRSLGALEPLVSALSAVPLALGYGAGLILLLRHPRPRALLVAAFAPAGRMSLTNYLGQSIVFSFVFYGWGAGRMGQLASAPAAVLAVGVYVAQAVASAAWLRRFRFGPFEWFWRSLTYGRLQPMRLSP